MSFFTSKKQKRRTQRLEYSVWLPTLPLDTYAFFRRNRNITAYITCREAQVMEFKGASNFDVDISTLPSGVYVVTNSQGFSERLVVLGP